MSPLREDRLDERLTVSVTLTRRQWQWLRGALQALAVQILTGRDRASTAAALVLDATGRLQQQMPGDLDEPAQPR